MQGDSVSLASTHDLLHSHSFSFIFPGWCWGRRKRGEVETYRIASEVPKKRAHDWHQIPFLFFSRIGYNFICNDRRGGIIRYGSGKRQKNSRRRATRPKAMRSAGDKFEAQAGGGRRKGASRPRDKESMDKEKEKKKKSNGSFAAYLSSME